VLNFATTHNNKQEHPTTDNNTQQQYTTALWYIKIPMSRSFLNSGTLIVIISLQAKYISDRTVNKDIMNLGLQYF
jgi:hypothetical protein